MAITKMKKFTLFTFDDSRDVLMTQLQKVEAVQFIDLKDNVTRDEYNYLEIVSNEEKLSKLEEIYSKIKFSIAFVENYADSDKGLGKLLKGKKELTSEQLRREYESINWEEDYLQLKNCEEELNQWRNKVGKLETEIEALSPWEKLDVSFDQLEELQTCSYFIGSIPKNSQSSFMEKFNRDIALSYMEIISEVKEDLNIIILFHNSEKDKIEELLKNFNFTKASIANSGKPSELISKYREQIKSIRKFESETVEKVKEYARCLEDYKLCSDYIATEIEKYREQNNFLKIKDVVAIQGWVPEEKIGVIEKLVSKHTTESYLEFEDPKKDDDVPILLKNNGFAEAFEPVTSMYSLPNYFETDPTPVMAIFMFVFFGAMLSDAGYGFIILIASILALKKVPLEPSQRKFIKLFMYFGISTIFWGVIYGSYFGDALSDLVKPVWVDPSKSPMDVLILGIIMGTIHLFTGLGMKGYQLIKDGKWLDAVFDVGFWYATLIGAILMLLGVEPWGKYLAIFGALGIVLTQGRSNKSVPGKLMGGLYELYGITGYLGDFLSYARLLALGLATGLIGTSFNLMANLLGDGIIAVIFGTIIFVGGHTFNLAINSLGAYVHAARLQYLEFFGKFYNGGGKAFTPFKSRDKHFRISNGEEE